MSEEGGKRPSFVFRVRERQRWAGTSERARWWAGIPPPSCFEQESGGGGQERVRRAGNARPSCFE